MSSHRIAVLLATRDGCGVLRETLAGYSRLLAPSVPWQLVVIDNGSVDGTRSVLREYADRLPLVVLDEPRLGKNRALNRALGLVEASFYVFTDDDAVPDETFLTGWEEVACARPDFGIFGGVVTPAFPAELTEWLDASRSRFAELFAENDRPEGTISARHIFGPNMGVRGSVFAAGHWFDEAIGPNGEADYAMGSETEFCERVERVMGASAWFTRQARVQHIVRAEQLSLSYFIQRAFRHGRGFARQQLRRDPGAVTARTVAGAGLREARHLLRAASTKGPAHYGAVWQRHWWRGYLREIRTRATSAGIRARGECRRPDVLGQRWT